MAFPVQPAETPLNNFVAAATEDKDFLEEFRKRPYVFSYSACSAHIAGICSGNRIWCMEQHNRGNGFEFYSGSESIWSICSVTQIQRTWHFRGNSGDQKTFSSVAKAIEYAFSYISQGQELQFLTYDPVPGIVWGIPLAFENHFLVPKDVGACFAVVKGGAATVHFRSGVGVGCLGFPHKIARNPASRDPADIKRWILDSVKPHELAFFNQSQGINLSEQLTLCTSLMDLGPLLYLDHECRKKVISGFTASQFEHIEHILLTADSEHEYDPLICYKDLLLFFAKTGNIQVKIHFSKYIWNVFSPNCNLAQLHEHLAEFRSTLSGDQLEWALDRYYEAIFYNTNAARMVRKFAVPLVEPRKQKVFNKPEFGTDLQVQLQESKCVIHVHRIFLAVFSEKLIRMMYNGYEESRGTSFCFQKDAEKAFSDEVVTQLLGVIYGSEPDFTYCKLVELLQLSNDILSEQFTDLINIHLNKCFDEKKVTLEVLAEIMLSPYWMHLPDLSSFFRYVSGSWSELIEGYSEEDQRSFREAFFTKWYEFISPKTSLENYMREMKV